MNRAVARHVLTAAVAATGALVVTLAVGSTWDVLPTPENRSETAVVVSGDEYRDCLAMADRSGYASEVCEPLGPDYQARVEARPVDRKLAASLARDEDPDRDWSACVVLWGDTSVIVCPDGFTLTS